MMARGEVDAVVTGADRIAANGDTANKIGTYSLAVLAAHHGIPLYVVAPTSTVDLATPTGAEIPIEERAGRRGDGALRRAQPRLRRHAGRAGHGDRHRARRAPGAVRRVAGAARWPAMKAIILAAGLRDPPPSADRLDREAAAPGRRPADDRLDLRHGRGGRRRRRSTSSRTRASPATSARWADGRDGVDRPRRRHDLERRPARRDRRHRAS